MHPTATRSILSPPSCSLDSPTLACALIPPTCDNGFLCFSFFCFFLFFFLIYHQSLTTSKNSYTSKCSALESRAKMMFINGKKLILTHVELVSERLPCAIFLLLRMWKHGIQEVWKPFLKVYTAPDGSLACESTLETRSKIMSSEMWWCEVSIYLTDAQLHPHSPTQRCIEWHWSPTHFPTVSLFQSHAHTSFPTPLYL